MRFISWTVPARELIVWLETCQERSRPQSLTGAGEGTVSIAYIRSSSSKREMHLGLMQPLLGARSHCRARVSELLTAWGTPLLSWLRASWLRPPYDTGNQYRA